MYSYSNTREILGQYVNNKETTKLTTKKQHKIKRNRCSSCGWGIPYKVSIKKNQQKKKKQTKKRKTKTYN
jgi:hypothetical protein